MDERYQEMRALYEPLYNNADIAQSIHTVPELMPYWQHISACLFTLNQARGAEEIGDHAGAEQALAQALALHDDGLAEPAARAALMQALQSGRLDDKGVAAYRALEATLFAPQRIGAPADDGLGL